MKLTHFSKTNYGGFNKVNAKNQTNGDLSLTESQSECQLKKSKFASNIEENPLLRKTSNTYNL